MFSVCGRGCTQGANSPRNACLTRLETGENGWMDWWMWLELFYSLRFLNFKLPKWAVTFTTSLQKEGVNNYCLLYYWSAWRKWSFPHNSIAFSSKMMTLSIHSSFFHLSALLLIFYVSLQCLCWMYFWYKASLSALKRSYIYSVLLWIGRVGNEE